MPNQCVCIPVSSVSYCLNMSRSKLLQFAHGPWLSSLLWSLRHRQGWFLQCLLERWTTACAWWPDPHTASAVGTNERIIGEQMGSRTCACRTSAWTPRNIPHREQQLGLFVAVSALVNAVSDLASFCSCPVKWFGTMLLWFHATPTQAFCSCLEEYSLIAFCFVLLFACLFLSDELTTDYLGSKFNSLIPACILKYKIKEVILK